MAAWQSPVAGAGRFRSAPGPIGVSFRPAIPRRVAPQQSPPPLHRSPTIVADPARASNALAQPHCKDNALPWLSFAATRGVISTLHAG
jgi:hypothetical protein